VCIYYDDIDCSGRGLCQLQKGCTNDTTKPCCCKMLLLQWPRELWRSAHAIQSTFIIVTCLSTQPIPQAVSTAANTAAE
jgi:hypothetical protein